MLGKQRQVSGELDVEALHERPRLAAETQLVDSGGGSVTVWRVQQTKLVLIPPNSHGIFYAGDCYLVKYTYWARGRERHILYYWLVSDVVGLNDVMELTIH